MTGKIEGDGARALEQRGKAREGRGVVEPSVDGDHRGAIGVPRNGRVVDPKRQGTDRATRGDRRKIDNGFRQRGLVRILRYKGNWLLREEVLKRIGGIPSPSDELAGQVLTILSDDNIYYEARVIASNALIGLLKNNQRLKTIILSEKAKLESITSKLSSSL